MADVKKFYKVETSDSSLSNYIGLSEDLISKCVNIAKIAHPVIEKRNCANLGDINRVFSHDFRAFLEAEGLSYDSVDPSSSNVWDVKEYTKVGKTPPELSNYEAVSRNLVAACVGINMASGNATVTTIDCVDKAAVNKVFSHTIRAFLAWKDLQYNEEEPKSQT